MYCTRRDIIGYYRQYIRVYCFITLIILIILLNIFLYCRFNRSTLVLYYAYIALCSVLLFSNIAVTAYVLLYID